MYHDDPNQLFQKFLLTSCWYYKLVSTEKAAKKYVLRWENDRLDLNQKITFFNENGNKIIHHVIDSQSSDLIFNEIEQQLINNNHNQVIKHEGPI